MARVTRVARAQQRYATVPVIDPETNQPKKTPVMKGDKQKTTKTGRPVFMTVTVQDRTKPLAPYECDFCRKPIEVGTPYKHMSPKSGPYGGRKLTRHDGCPTWNVWEYSNSLSAQLARISHDFWEGLDGVESPDDIQSLLDDAASSIEEIAEQKRESAGNIEEGFGHATSASEELEEIADSLESWASEVESADIPDLPDVEERYFVTNGDGQPSPLFEPDGYDTEADAEHALMMHRDDENNEDDGLEIEAVTPEEPTAEQLDEWRSEVQDALSIIDESPV